MNLFRLSIANLKARLLPSLLSMLLLALGIGIILLLISLNNQFTEKMTRNLKGIDMVVGAKGSPLQLILSGIYQIDYPTGNIPLKAAREIANHKLVKQTIPMAYGDSYEGFRIVGTDENYLKQYQLTFKKGELWNTKLKAVLGADVAAITGLRVGDTFLSSHGLSNQSKAVKDMEHYHEEHPFEVVGILSKSNMVADQLILADIESVWAVHEQGAENKKEKEHINSKNGERKTEYGERKTEDGGRRTEYGERKTEDGGRKTEYGERKTEDGERKTEDGGRKTEYGERKMEDGGRKMEDGGRKTEDGERKMEDGGRKTEDGERKTEDGERKMEDGGRKTEDGGRKTEDGERKTEDGGRKTEDGERKTEDAEHIHNHEGEHEEHGEHIHNHKGEHEEDREITVLLVKFKNPAMGMIQVPRWVNKKEGLQAAIPAAEINRLFGRLGIGIQVLRLIAMGIMLIAGLSVFISLYDKLQERKYELALMRSMGASRIQVFSLVLLEALILALLGFILAFLLSRLTLYIFNTWTFAQYHDTFSVFRVYQEEVWVFVLCILLGLIAALIPAWQAYRLDIAKALADN